MPRTKNKTRKDGRIQAKVYIGKEDSGKKKYKYVYALTNKELEEKVRDIKQKLGKGIDILAQRDTFDEWGQRWLRRKEAKVCAGWNTTVQINYKKLEPIHGVPVSQLRCADLEDILVDLQQQGYSARVMQSVKQIAAGIMKDCVKNRVIEYNPFADAEMPKAEESGEEPRRALTSEEQSWITDTPHRAQTAAMIMMYAGLRRGELIPLLWSDVDLENGTIKVERFVAMEKGQPVLKEGGKSKAAHRTVYIPKRLVNYLRGVKRDGLLVVHMTNGKMFTANAWRTMWESYLKDLNFKYGDFGSLIVDGKPYNKPKSKCVPGGVPVVIPRFTAHWLRHTFITLMYLSGVDVLTASKQAGHSDVKLTMEIYTHLDEEFKKKSIVKLDEYLGEGCRMGVKNTQKYDNQAKAV